MEPESPFHAVVGARAQVKFMKHPNIGRPLCKVNPAAEHCEPKNNPGT
jgi:hypothetical protein